MVCVEIYYVIHCIRCQEVFSDDSVTGVRGRDARFVLRAFDDAVNGETPEGNALLSSLNVSR